MNEHPEFAKRLLAWYKDNHRDLPWRNTKDPYKIWLSEIILQQTRVQQGLPYYKRFVQEFPSVHDLAEASEEAVLRLWQGLGYYSRARNLHQAAKTVAYELGGEFPDNYKALKKLKGVGDYTAAAIASFAFQEAAAVLDGNVFRVLARVFGVDTDIASTEGKKQFAQLSQSLIHSEEPDTYNQAIMEFGAMHCKPSNPDCMFCPMSDLCEAKRLGRVGELPVKIKKTKVKDVYFDYLVISFEDRILMRLRDQKGIWQGLYDFYCLESPKKREEEEVLSLCKDRLKDVSVEIAEISPERKHILSHQRIFARFFHLYTDSLSAFEGLALDLGLLVTDSEIREKLPKPKLVFQYLEECKKR